jgi:hypothetical protein
MVRSKQKVFQENSGRCALSIKVSQSWTSKNQTALRTNDVIISRIILFTRKFVLLTCPPIESVVGISASKIWKTYTQALDVPRLRALSKQKGSNMKAACCQPRRLFSGLVVVTVVCFALTPILSAQGVDPGPRPPGSTPFPPSVCGIVAGIGNDKFNNAAFGNPACFDIDQPPSNPPQPPAAGAGQIINGSGSLGAMWFQALTVFSATAIVSSSITPRASGWWCKPGNCHRKRQDSWHHEFHRCCIQS